jgi:hypothetical protein
VSGGVWGLWGVRGDRHERHAIGGSGLEGAWKGRPEKVRVLYREAGCDGGGRTRVPRATRRLVGSREAHLPRLNTAERPIVDEYREGTVKRTPVTGSEREPETVCLQTVSAGVRARAMACLLHNEPASYLWLRG